MYNNTIVNLIASMDLNNGIGHKNTIQWHIPEDLKYFKCKTINNTVIMGRNTFESIGKILPNRLNIVVSTTMKPTVSEKLHVINNLSDIQWNNIQGDLYVIGGQTLYSQFMDMADKIYITQVFKDTYYSDTFFPRIPDTFQIEWQSPVYFSKHDKLDYQFITFSKN